MLGDGIAEKHSMDIPHLTTVELPLNVKNNDRAIDMLGGKEKISSVINASNRTGAQGGVTGANDTTLELRLRKDPLHHPVQSLLNASERVLLKVSIPKENIPNDYKENPTKYSVRDLLELNEASDGPLYEVQPIGIINKTFSFKAMADFQVSTKNNKVVQDFNKMALGANDFKTMKEYSESHENFNSITDYKDPANFQNEDHQLPPPPLFSPIRFPFDYRYQKNPLTATVENSETGEVHVVSKKSTLKLHTLIIDFYKDPPQAPAPALVENFEALNKRNLPQNSVESHLLQCVAWLKRVFEFKPIWLRKQLEDIVPRDLKRVLKQALPYVSYIYKSGPWRFCNIKLGVDPRSDLLFWIYQSEYFRIPGLHFSTTSLSSLERVPLGTIAEDSRGNPELQVSERLVFDGSKLPLTVTYQVGDITDPDIVKLLNVKNNETFLRDEIDFQDGWINKRMMETIRGVVRYKLNRLVKEEAIEKTKIDKIINTDYYEDVLPEEKPDVDTDNENIDEDSDVIEDDNGEQLNEEDVMRKLKENDSVIASRLGSVVGLVKQDHLNHKRNQ